MIRFQDCTVGSLTFNKSNIIKKDMISNGSMTLVSEYKIGMTQTAIPAENATQTSNEESLIKDTNEIENQYEKYIKLDSFIEFIKDKGEIILNQLQCSEVSTAFEDEKNYLTINHDDMDITKQFTLSFDIMTHFNKGKKEGKDKDIQDIVSLDVTGISWNATGSVIGASYGRYDHSGWCDYRGVVCLWNIFQSKLNMNQPDMILETSSGLMCISLHPVIPSILCAGSFNGEVYLWNTAIAEEPLIAVSTIGDYFFREPVAQVSWIYNANMKEYLIASISGDGKLLFWSMNNKLKYPIQGSSFTIITKQKNSNDKANRVIVGGTSFSFQLGDKSLNSFVVGTEGGAIYRCFKKRNIKVNSFNDKRWNTEASKIMNNLPEKEQQQLKRHTEQYATQRQIREIGINVIYNSKPEQNWMYPNSIDFQYIGHNGPVHQISFSPFHRNLFLSCSTDGTICLYHVLQKKYLLKMDTTDHSIYSVQWSRTRPLVFSAVSEEGIIYIYDLDKNKVLPVAKIQDEDKKSNIQLYCLDFNPKQRNFLAAGGNKGSIHIWKLNWQLSNYIPSELEKLNSIADLTTVSY